MPAEMSIALSRGSPACAHAHRLMLAPRPPSRSPPTYDPHSTRCTAGCHTSRDFVPWRFSDAGRRSAWIASSCRRPKTYTDSDLDAHDCEVRFARVNGHRQASHFRNVPMIGIGGSLAAPPLPHHRTYGSVYGGSRSYANALRSNDSTRVGWAFGFMHHRERFDVFPQRLPGFTRRRR